VTAVASVGSASQLGFSFDANRCVQCRSCELACKGTNDLKPGIWWRRVSDRWSGAYPSLTRSFASQACRHCAEPACAAACKPGAITKRNEDGLVVVDRAKCDGCRDCLEACPYDVPAFGDDGIMQKCDYCLSVGVDPVCARSCPSGALGFGPLDQLTHPVKG
jgi:anaerobic dimethyl sulfoxide reductase subunit B (iron-sulfur subunit)